MKTSITYCLLLSFLFMMTSFSSFSQEENKLDIEPISKYFIKTNFRLPFTRSNEFLKEISEGVVDLQGSFNYSFYKNFYIGLGFRYSYFKLSEKKLNSSAALDERFNGKLEQKGFYGELSYFYNVYDNFAIEANFQVGMENTVGNSSMCTAAGSKTSNKGIFYSPNLNFHLKTEEIFTFYFSFGYNFSNTRFTPETVCADSFANYKEMDYAGNYRHINVGFGVGISITKPKK